MKAQSYQVVYVVFIVGSLLIHYAVVLFALYKYATVYSTVYKRRYWSIVATLFRFVAVFSLIRFFPALDRIVVLLSDAPPPFWLVMAHHVGIASLGIGDGFVWYLNLRSEDADELALLKEQEKKETKAKVVFGVPPPRFREYKEQEPDVLETPDQVHHVWTDSEYDTEAEVLSVEQKTKRQVVMYRGRM